MEAGRHGRLALGVDPAQRFVDERRGELVAAIDAGRTAVRQRGPHQPGPVAHLAGDRQRLQRRRLAGGELAVAHPGLAEGVEHVAAPAAVGGRVHGQQGHGVVVVAGGLAMGEQRRRPGPGPQQHRDGLVDVGRAGADEPVVGGLVEPVVVEAGERPGHPAMALPAQVQRHVLDQDLAHQGVDEPQRPAGRVDDVGRHRDVERVLDLGVAHTGHVGHQVGGDLPADQRGGREDVELPVGQRPQVVADHRGDGRRQAFVAQSGDLAHEVGVAVGAGGDALDRGGRAVVAGDRAEELAHLVDLQAPQPDRGHRDPGQLGQRGGEPVVAVDVHLAAGCGEQQAGARQQRGQVLDQQKRRLVGPLDVLDDHDQRQALGPAQQEATGGVEQAEPGALVVGRDHGLGPGDARRVRQHRDQAGQKAGVAGVLGQVAARSGVGGRPEHLEPRPEGRSPACLGCPAPHDGHPPGRAVAGRLLDEAALADAGLPGHERHATLADAGPVDGGPQRGEVAVAAHERAVAGAARDRRGQVDGDGRCCHDPGPRGRRRGRRQRRAGRPVVAGGDVQHPQPGRRPGGGRRQQVVVAVDDPPLQVEDLAPRLDAQLQAEDAPDLPGGAQRVGPAAGPVAGDDQLGPVALVEGLVDDQPLEQREDLAVAADGEQGVGATLLGHPVEAAPVVQRLVCPAGTGELGKGVAPPQGEGVVEGGHAVGEVGLVDAGHDQLLELDRVDVVRDHQLVASRARRERRPARGGSQLLAELRDVRSHGLRRPGRRMLAPQRVDDRLDRGRLARTQHEQGQQGAPLGPTQVERAVRTVRLEGAEHAKPHPDMPH